MIMHTFNSEKLARDLWKAVRYMYIDTEEVQSLLDQGADPNHESYWSEEWTSRKRLPPLHSACVRGYVRKVKVLIQRGADTNKGDPIFNLTPLQRACLAHRKQVVEYLNKEVKCKVGE